MTKGHNSTGLPADRGHWVSKAYPTAGESITFYSPPPRDRDPEHLPAQTDPAELRRRSLSRSRTAVRRYIVANALTTLWGLTFRPDHSTGRCGTPSDAGDGWCSCGRPVSRAAALAVVPAFVRELRADLWHGAARPYLAVAEPHKDGHWHVHLAVAGFMPWQRVERAWGHGSVGVTGSAKSRAPAGRTRTTARAVSGYVAKYLAKSWEVDEDLDGQQRYRVAERFQPAVVERIIFRPNWTEGLNAALELSRRSVPGRVIRQWDSDDVEDWSGPRTVLLVHGDVQR